MKKIFSALILVILAIVLMVVPFFMSLGTRENISVGASLVSTLASLVTLLIAVLLYSKYGAEKTVLTKQIDTALRFLAELKKTRFVISGDRVTLFLSLDRLHVKHYKEYMDRELLFGRSYIDGLNSIWQIGEDIFLPKAIAEKMNLLTIEVITSCTVESKHLKVGAMGCISGDDEMMGIINQKSTTLGQYIALWDDVIKTSIGWVDKHSDANVALNFNKNL